ncbi:MAG: hypothetical protein DVB22_001574 [Verrucomicrobia bacterium]|nr:MAG: hypothetical protein DVB22_001574 [Verrucomicrobiota bacterium]
MSIAAIAMLGLCGGSQALGQAYTWNTVSGGSWNQNSNWTPSTSFPNGFNDTATIQQDISGPTTINLNAATMLNRLTLGDSVGTSPYTIAPNGGSLTFRATQNLAVDSSYITSSNGANVITAPIAMDNTFARIANTGGGSLTLSSISSVRGGGYRFLDNNTKVLPGGGMTSVNGIGNVFAINTSLGSGIQSWTTYDSVTGAVGALPLASYGTLAASNSTTNVTQANSATLSANTTMNSFRWTTANASTLGLGANDMTIISGGILRSAAPNHRTEFTTTGGKIITPTGVPLTVWQNSSNQMTFSAPIQVDGMNLYGRIIFNTSASSSTFGTGDINIFGGGYSTSFVYAPTLSNNVNISNADGSSLSFTPTAPGTMTLSGTVTVNGVLTGNANGAYSIRTLAGYGSSSVTPITVTTNLAPGDGGTGTLDLANNLTLAAASIYKVQLGGTTPGDGKGFYDQVNMTSATGAITLNTGAALDFSLADGFAPTPADNFFIMTRADTSSWGNYFLGTTEGGFVTFGDGLNNYTGQITYQANWIGTQLGSALTGGNDVAFYNIQGPTPVPEPASAVTVLALFSSGVLNRRKRAMRH